MNKKTLLNFWVLLLCMVVGGASTAWAQSDFSALYTSNVTLPSSGNGTVSSCIVNVNTTQYNGTKLGKNGAGASATFQAPAGTKYIHLHVAAWNGQSTGFTYKVGDGTAQSISGITSNSGIKGNPPFTFDGDASSSNYYKVITLDNPLASDTDITFSSTSERAVFWGVNTESVAAPSYDITALSNNNSYGTVALEGSVITATPADGYRVSTSEPYTVSPANSATVSQNGNVFTVTPSENTTVTINFEAIPTYTVSVGSITGGTLTLKNGDDEVASGSSVREGTILTVVPNASEGYQFASWSDGTNVYTDEFTYTVTSDVVFTATFDEVVTHKVNWFVNGEQTSENVAEGATVVFPSDPDDVNTLKFQGWVTAPIDGRTNDKPSFVTEATMGTSDLNFYAVFATVTPGQEEKITDVLTNATTGVGSSTSYSNWSGKTVTSSAVYAGNTAGGNSSIQLRSNNSDSGVVSTTSGGKVSKIVVEWEEHTSTGRTLDIYGKNAAYSSASDLYSAQNQGTKLGSVVYGTSTELTVTGDYDYIGLRSNSGAMYLSSIAITWTQKADDVITGYCTTVSSLPIPVITMEDVEMTWGDEDKSVTPTAKIGEDDYEGAFIFTSSDDTKLTVASDGKLTCNVPGIYTVTASIAETGEYQSAEVTCNVTVDKKGVTLNFDSENVLKMDTDEQYAQTVSVTPAAYDGVITYALTANTSDAIIDENTGELLFTTTGIATITATAPETELYLGNTASYTLTIKTLPTITVSDQTLVYGEQYEPTIVGGDVEITAEPNLISVEKGVITAAVVGTATVTVRTTANDTYAAGEETFNLVVTAPAGETTAPNAFITVFEETFSESTGGPLVTWGGSEANGTLKTDNNGWTMTSGAGAGSCAKFGTGSIAGSATSPSITVASGEAYTLTFKTAPWSTDANQTVTVTVTGGTINGNSSTTTSKLTNKEWNDFEFEVVATSASMTIGFNCSANRFFLDEIKLASPIEPTATVSLNKYGLATYCSQYPMDFSSTQGYTAWRVTGVSNEGVVSLEKITEAIKGGQGVLLYNKNADGVNTSEVTVNFADGDTEYSEAQNKFFGTTAPTYVDNEEYLGLSGNKFVKVNAGTIPAGKALLPVSVLPAGARELTFQFEDDGQTTGISDQFTVNGEKSVYDLQGRKVEKTTKGLYIVNGRKVVVK